MSSFVFSGLESNVFQTSSHNSTEWDAVYTTVKTGSAAWVTPFIQPGGTSCMVQYNIDRDLKGDAGFTNSLSGTVIGYRNSDGYILGANWPKGIGYENGLTIGAGNSGVNLYNDVIIGSNNICLNNVNVTTPTCQFDPNTACTSYYSFVQLITGTAEGQQQAIPYQYCYYFDRLNGDPLNEAATSIQQFCFGQYNEMWERNGCTWPFSMCYNRKTVIPTTTGDFTRFSTVTGSNSLTGSFQNPGSDIWGDEIYYFYNGTRTLSTPEYTEWCFACVCVYQDDSLYLPALPAGQCYTSIYQNYWIGYNVCIRSPLQLTLSSSFVVDFSAFQAYGLFPNTGRLYYETYMRTTSAGTSFVNPPNTTSGVTVGVNNNLGIGGTNNCFRALGGTNNCFQNVTIGGSFNCGNSIGGEQHGFCYWANSNHLNGSYSNSYKGAGGYKNGYGCGNYYAHPFIGRDNDGGSFNGRMNRGGGDPSGYSWCSIVAGEDNRVYDYQTTVLGGLSNFGNNSYGSVWAGACNGATYGALVMGGCNNSSYNGVVFIGAGRNNCIENNYPTEYYNDASFIGAGANNRIKNNGNYTSILGGENNWNCGKWSAIAGSGLSATREKFASLQNLSAQCYLRTDGVYFNELSATTACCNNTTTYTGMFLTVNVAGSSLLLPLYT